MRVILIRWNIYNLCKVFDRQIRLLCDPHLVVIVPWLVIPVLHYLATRETIWFQRSLAFWLRWHKPGYVLTLVFLCQSITIMFDLVIYCKILRPLLCIHGEWLRPREGLGTMKPSQLVVFGYTVTVKQVISETFDVNGNAQHYFRKYWNVYLSEMFKWSVYNETDFV